MSNLFRHPSYWTIDGKPYFSIYELYRLVEGLGGMEAARDALESFQRKAVAAGLPGLHLNAVTWGVQVLPGEKRFTHAADVLKALGFASTTSYVWVHHVRLKNWPVTAYTEVAAEMARYWRKAATESPIPYHPNVTMGWDSSPRTCQSDIWTNSGYPYTPVLGGNTPAAFRAALAAAREFINGQPGQPPVLTLNAWNEWTEGSYLEPDTDNGFGYLEAVKSVFG